MINPIKNSTKNIKSLTKTAERYINIGKKYSNIVIYSVVGFLTIIAIVYTSIYFCTCCCARCLAASFCSFGLFMTILLGIPCIVFSVLFFLFYDGCPNIEPAIDELGHEMISENKNISYLFTCPSDLEDKTIYSIAGLDKYLDYEKLIDDLRVHLQSSLRSFDPDESLDALNSLTSVNTFNSFALDYLAGIDISANRERVSEIPTGDTSVCTGGISSGDVEQLIGHLESIVTAYQGMLEEIQEANESANAAIGFAKTMKPQVQTTINISDNMILDFTSGSLRVIRHGIDRLDCTLICQVYSPAKNTICVHLVDGFSFWILSAIIMIIGMALMSISLCIRRRGMLPPQVEDYEEEEDESEFEVSSRRHHHRHHRYYQ